MGEKPEIFWLEGVLDFFNAPFPHEPDDINLDFTNRGGKMR